jgi:hypothetical protein
MYNKMNDNYMDSIYELINVSDEEYYYDDGIEYLDDPVDEFNYYDDELSWADNITYLDEPEEDEFDLDLGEGFIPLPQGDYYQEELVVIDENYALDEYEEDLIENYTRPAIEEQQEVQYSMDDIYSFINDTDEIELNLDNVESIIQFPVQQELVEELKVTDLNEEDDKIAKAIAKEHIDNVKAGEAVGAIFGDNEKPEDDTSWVDDNDDPFGNDISVIIAEDPNEEVVEDDFVEGSFQDWITQQKNQ